jgi:hypothetical protein
LKKKGKPKEPDLEWEYKGMRKKKRKKTDQLKGNSDVEEDNRPMKKRNTMVQKGDSGDDTLLTELGKKKPTNKKDSREDE